MNRVLRGSLVPLENETRPIHGPETRKPLPGASGGCQTCLHFTLLWSIYFFYFRNEIFVVVCGYWHCWHLVECLFLCDAEFTCIQRCVFVQRANVQMNIAHKLLIILRSNRARSPTINATQEEGSGGDKKRIRTYTALVHSI